MKSFLHEIIEKLISEGIDFQNSVFILPNKRAGLFLKQALSKQLKQTLFSPEIISSQEFVTNLSELKELNNIDVLFKFYETYCEITSSEQTESFDQFSSWAQILINDFIELDRYLIDPNKIFDYLSAIKEIDHWSVEPNKTEHVKNYLQFWNHLKTYYTHFNHKLTSEGVGHQGLQYREAVNNIENYIENNNKQHFFIGFNALNKAEEIIIQELLSQNLAKVFWDIDIHFLDNNHHDAGFFVRKYKEKWPYFRTHLFEIVSNNFRNNKNIQVIGAIKTVGQVKQIGALLKDLYTNNATNLENTAVVLGDEQQLLPLLNSLPTEIEHINITMGLPLKSVPLSSFFELLFNLHKSNNEKYYYKDVIAILNHSSLKPIYSKIQAVEIENFIQYISKNNLSYFDYDVISKHIATAAKIIDALFCSWENNPVLALKNCRNMVLEIQTVLNKNSSAHLVELSFLYKFYTIFNKLIGLQEQFSFINSIQILFGLYKELLNIESVDFKGEPLKGLQIMGVLESRLLDFETVIISGVNEGVLPAGKQHNSFIPFDVKLENLLPTFKEKDAIYTYHFYRLLQRAKNIYIIYNTDPDVLSGGEPSRFIKQLEIDGIHHLTHSLSIPNAQIKAVELKSVSKTATLLDDLKDLAIKGFSPSSLSSYVRNPIDFYYSKVLNINEYDEVEETIAANTLGNVLHKTLEEMYKPYVGEILEEKHIKTMFKSIDGIVAKHFKTYFYDGNFTSGKNLISFEVAKRYIYNFLQRELEQIKAGRIIVIKELEKPIQVTLDIPELGFPIHLKGVIDRIDTVDNDWRIIDYKSGKVNQSEVEIVNWEDLTSDYKKYSKSFQLLTYAYMLHQTNVIQLPVNAGIISFKNLQDNFVLNFSKKNKAGNGAVKDPKITTETLDAYFEVLKNLILEIFNPEIDFTEKIIE
ncbi:PD-(D/E)XK nuclease family protein [Paucihalobacter ruber]|uniref:PD-(D/E)XK nuclease family protein n=1 Tax=Paucihalobacter ruber TaxID=2567861 RepID=A0A506PMS5_9FLAO|nr:PD-(D/E)XK nuclease family protein [Paucihalobacter ruber]TPV34838.1 PD-(D/E)XK nuclease family protein [Paucihalobacter ruber]